ncbi:uncharacterized protein N7483_002057 [Penicillium malachiteum]|uniref:uncharacterized protein n=1 Tax=Penicillium malachiteum TaxID=1324776 RepID=UPI0025482CC4|nr:uncharacterized protein N7483_002057 [Penicillium malachiteum]KAJ5736932.1 hypothetical protein N7483_002057 [Penicillium malachiteum]
MKLIVVGATGLVGSEIIRQSLEIDDITEVIALARKFVQVEKNSPSSKLTNVIVRDYAEYPEDVKAKLSGADACIWTVAITPFRASNFPFAEVKRVCQDCTLAGFKAIYEAGPKIPFRFVYFSAEGTPRDPSHRPMFMGDYQVMRSHTENMVIGFPGQYPGTQICIAQPGVVINSTTWSRATLAFLLRGVNLFTRKIPNVDRSELSAAVLHQAVHGVERETLLNADLVRLGQLALKARGYL